MCVGGLDPGVGQAVLGARGSAAGTQLVLDPFDVIPLVIAAAESYGLLANLARAAGHGPMPLPLGGWAGFEGM